MDLAKASKILSSDIQQQLKFFERNVDNWADVAKVLSRINEEIQPYPTGTQILCFPEFMQRIGQCVGRNPELPQGVHLTVIAIYETLIKLLGHDLGQYLDALFIPLLPLYSFASIPTRRAIMQLMKNLLACDIDKRYIGPIVASLLSTQPADSDEAASTKDLLDSLETSFGVFYIDSLFKLLKHPCEARRNVLNVIYQLIKKYLEQSWDLTPFDNHEEYLLSVLDSAVDDEIRVTLDIIALLYPLPNVYTQEVFSLFKRFLTKMLTLLQRDQTIASRVEQWLFSAIPETYSRVLLATLQDLFQNAQGNEQVVSSLFTELARREEILDAFLASFPVLVQQIFPTFPHLDQVRAFLDKEDFVKIYVYRAVLMQLVAGTIQISIGEITPTMDFLKETNLVATKQELTLHEKLEVVRALSRVVPAFPSVRGLRAFATEHKDSVDVFGGIIYATDEQGSVVVGELVAFVMNLYCETYCDDCLNLVLSLMEKGDSDAIVSALTKDHAGDLDILKGYSCVYQRLQEEIIRNDQLLTSVNLHKILVFIVQTTTLALADQTWLLQTLLCIVGQRLNLKAGVQVHIQDVIDDNNEFISSEKFRPEETNAACTTLIRLLQEKSQAQTPLWHYIEQWPQLADRTVCYLFGSISEIQTDAGETLCCLCSQHRSFYLQKLETLIAQRIYDKETQSVTVQNFILLWQIAAEKYPELKLFKRLTLLLVDMCVRPDVLEQTRLMVTTFVARIFQIKEWAAQLIDIAFCSLGGWPDIQSDDTRVWLKRKTETEFYCDVGKIEYVFSLVNMLISAHKEQFVTRLIETSVSQSIPKLCFYKQDYKPTTQLDLWIDFAMCFVLADDKLPQKLISQIVSFVSQILQALKQLMNRTPELINVTCDISDRVSEALLQAMLTSKYDSAAQEVFLSILDTASHMVLLRSTSGSAARLVCGDMVQIPEIFTNLLKKQFLEQFLNTLKDAKIHTLRFINKALEILATLKVELSQADTNTYISTWVPSIDVYSVQNLQAKFLPPDIIAALTFDECFDELDKKAEYYANKVRTSYKEDKLRQISKKSFAPAKYKFYPACFLALSTVEKLRDVVCKAKTISVDLAYALIQLLEKCSSVLTQSKEQSYALVQYQSITVQKDKFIFDLIERKKEVELTSDFQNAFAISGLVQTIIELLDKTEVNGRSVGKKTLEHAGQTLRLLSGYNSLLTALTIIMHLHSTDSFGVAAVVNSAMEASEYIRAGAFLNFFKQKQFDFTPYKTLLPHEALFFGATAGYAFLSQFLTLSSQITDTDVLTAASARSYFSQQDLKSLTSSLIQFHYSKAGGFTGNFCVLNPSEQMLQVDAFCGLFSPASVKKIIRMLHFAASAEQLAQQQEDDRTVIKRFLARAVAAGLSHFEAFETPKDQATLLNLVHCVAKQLAGDVVQRYPTEQEKTWMEKLISLNQTKSWGTTLVRAAQCNQNLTFMISAVPYLLQFALQNRPTRTKAVEILHEFSRLEIAIQKRMFQHSICANLKDILKATPEVISSLGQFIGVGATDLPELFTQFGAKKQEPRQVIETLATLFAPEAVPLDQLEIAICQQARNPDKNFYQVALYLDAVLISQTPEHIKDHWINIVEFITAGKQAQVKDLDITCYLLGTKCPDKQIFVGFLDQIPVQDPYLWLCQRIVEQWAALQ